MDRLNEYAPLVNEFDNKNIHVLTINNVVKTIADVVRNYLLEMFRVLAKMSKHLHVQRSY